MKKIGIILSLIVFVAGVSTIVILCMNYFVDSKSRAEDKYKKVFYNSTKLELCQIKGSVTASSKCYLIDMPTFKKAIADGGLTLPGKNKIRLTYLLHATRHGESIGCFKVNEYEDKSLSVIISNIKADNKCKKIEKYLGGWNFYVNRNFLPSK